MDLMTIELSDAGSSDCGQIDLALLPPITADDYRQGGSVRGLGVYVVSNVGSMSAGFNMASIGWVLWLVVLWRDAAAFNLQAAPVFLTKTSRRTGSDDTSSSILSSAEDDFRRGTRYLSDSHGHQDTEVSKRENVPHSPRGCYAGGPVDQQLNFHAGAWLNIFAEVSVICEGEVVEWEYFAQQDGVFYADIWRPVGGEEYVLIGSNRIAVNAPGHHVTEIDAHFRVRVEAGDVIGIHYPDETKEREGVISYEDSRWNPLVQPPPVESEDMSLIYSAPTRHSGLWTGSRVQGLLGAGVRRMPALKVYVECKHIVDVTMTTLGYPAVAGEQMDGQVYADYVTDPSLVVSQPGFVVGWDVFIGQLTNIALQVMRPLEDDRYQLVGRTWLYPTRTGKIHLELGDFRRIPVQPGDTLGLYFLDANSIPYTSYTPCSEENAMRFHIHHGDPADSGAMVEPGDTLEYTFNSDDCRRYSFSAELAIDSSLGVTTSTSEEPGPEVTTVVLPATTTVTTPVVIATHWSGSCGNPEIPPSVNDRIVGGVPVIAHSWPWMVNLQMGNLRCGGTLIAPQWVLTAAHCPFTLGDRVVLGAHVISQPAASQVTVTAVAYPHKSYERISHDTDISLLKLSQPMEFRAEISPVCLPDQDEEYPLNATCYTTGWGRTSAWGPKSDVLLQVEVPLLATSVCNKTDWYNGALTQNMICAGYERGLRDSCKGDSGGPLMCFHQGRWELVGVVSWGRGCARARRPGIYAKVAHYINWIEATMASS